MNVQIEKMSRHDVRVVENPDRVVDTGLTLQGLIVWEDPATGERWTHPDWPRCGGRDRAAVRRPVYDLDAIPEDPALATEPECCS